MKQSEIVSTTIKQKRISDGLAESVFFTLGTLGMLIFLGMEGVFVNSNLSTLAGILVLGDLILLGLHMERSEDAIVVNHND